MLTKIHQKMIDGSLTFQKQNKKWTKMDKKPPAKFPPRPRAKQRHKCGKIFLSPLTVRVIQKLTLQKDRIALETCKNITQNEPQISQNDFQQRGKCCEKDSLVMYPSY